MPFVKLAKYAIVLLLTMLTASCVTNGSSNTCDTISPIYISEFDLTCMSGYTKEAIAELNEILEAQCSGN